MSQERIVCQLGGVDRAFDHARSLGIHVVQMYSQGVDDYKDEIIHISGLYPDIIFVTDGSVGVVAHRGSLIRAMGRSSVWAYDSSQVKAMDDSVVYVYSQNCRVELHDRSNVSGDSVVWGRNVLDGRPGHLHLNLNCQPAAASDLISYPVVLDPFKGTRFILDEDNILA